MSRDTTKPTKWLCAQRRLRSAWASAQSDQIPSLIRGFAVRMKKAWVLNYPLSGQRRLWSDWADAQVDLSLRLAHTHFVGFVVSWLKCCCCFFPKHAYFRRICKARGFIVFTCIFLLLCCFKIMVIEIKHTGCWILKHFWDITGTSPCNSNPKFAP